MLEGEREELHSASTFADQVSAFERTQFYVGRKVFPRAQPEAKKESPTYYSPGRGRIPKCFGFPEYSLSQRGRWARSASPDGTEGLKTDNKFTGLLSAEGRRRVENRRV